MIDKKSLAQAARNIIRHQRGLKDPTLMHPEREWVIGLAIGLAICVLSASGSAYSYFTNKYLTAEVSETTEGETVYREAMIKDALKEFATRNQEREALLTNIRFAPASVVATSSATSSAESASSTAAATSTTPE